MTRIINSAGKIKALNIRKEGPQDDKVLAIDVKFGDVSITPELLARLLGSDEETVLASFWDEARDPRFLALDPIGSMAELRHCRVTIERMRLDDCLVRKFKVALGSLNACRAEFSVTVNSPTSNVAAVLAELVAEDVGILVDMAQGELELAA